MHDPERVARVEEALRPICGGPFPAFVATCGLPARALVSDPFTFSDSLPLPLSSAHAHLRVRRASRARALLEPVLAPHSAAAARARPQQFQELFRLFVTEVLPRCGETDRALRLVEEEADLDEGTRRALAAHLSQAGPSDAGRSGQPRGEIPATVAARAAAPVPAAGPVVAAKLTRRVAHAAMLLARWGVLAAPLSPRLRRHLPLPVVEAVDGEAGACRSARTARPWLASAARAAAAAVLGAAAVGALWMGTALMRLGRATPRLLRGLVRASLVVVRALVALPPPTAAAAVSGGGPSPQA